MHAKNPAIFISNQRYIVLLGGLITLGLSTIHIKLILLVGFTTPVKKLNRIQMGIKNLNRFLIDNCNKKSIKKIHLKSLANKTLVIDASIYLYKFMADSALLENMYLLISIFKHYSITPIFIFDGKPPPEKRDLLQKRKQDKRDAHEKYKELELTLTSELTREKREEILQELETLKRQFVRIKEEDVLEVKSLMDAYGVLYYNSKAEADQLCVYFVKEEKAWACLSDDMDMLLYGCKRVLRHISLLNHTLIYYDFDLILNDLQMSEQNFREIMVISGTDYNLNSNTSLFQTMKWFYEYNKYLFNGEMNINKYQSFYDWLLTNTKYIHNEVDLRKIYNMFLIDNYKFDKLNCNRIETKLDRDKLKSILRKDGFIF